MPRNYLWEVIQIYMDSPLHDYPPKPADVARRTGVSEQVLSKWKSKPTMPTPGQLSAISQGTGLPYSRLLEAALQGKGYLPPETGIRLEEIGDGGDPDLLAARTLTRRFETLEIAIRGLTWPDEDSREANERLKRKMGDFFMDRLSSSGVMSRRSTDSVPSEEAALVMRIAQEIAQEEAPEPQESQTEGGAESSA